MFNLGRYTLKCGSEAIVAQIKSIGKNSWVLRGVILLEDSNVLFLMDWSPDGICHGGNPKFDLMKKEETHS